MDEGDSRVGASLRERCEGNLEGALYYWEPWKICRKGDPLGNVEEGSCNGGVER